MLRCVLCAALSLLMFAWIPLTTAIQTPSNDNVPVEDKICYGTQHAGEMLSVSRADTTDPEVSAAEERIEPTAMTFVKDFLLPEKVLDGTVHAVNNIIHEGSDHFPPEILSIDKVPKA